MMNPEAFNSDQDALLDMIHIRIIPFDSGDPANRTRAFVELEIAGTIVLRGIKIIETKHGGLFLGFPSVRKSDGSFRDLVIIKNKTFLKRLRERILDCYHHLGSSHQDPQAGGKNESGLAVTGNLG